VREKIHVASLPAPERDRNSRGRHSAAAHDGDGAGWHRGDRPDESATAGAGSREHERNHSCTNGHSASRAIASAHVVRASCAGAETPADAGTTATPRSGTWTADPDARASRPGSGTGTARPDSATDPRAGTRTHTTRPDATTRPRPGARPSARSRTRTHATHPAAARPRAGARPSARPGPGTHTAPSRTGTRTTTHTARSTAATGTRRPASVTPARELRRTTAGMPRPYRPGARKPEVP
jgi:hypothetical protein